ncbi:MAG TPA: hypothetical protein PKC70_13935, partial [Cellvibrionaceae bacterium]|nr:hypothetical protein [Cellvibrionaceae bacterium]HNG61689.1 hypothetical protein [Cellvibrionaceae bacterium]
EAIFPSGAGVLHNSTKSPKISGVWDLLMWGGERLFVKRQFHSLMNDGAVLDVSTFDGSYVQSYDRELVFSLQEFFGDIDGYPSDDLIRPLSHPNNYCPMDGLPKDSFLVIRTEALSEFENNLRFKEKSEMRTPKDTLVEALGLMTLLLAETSPNLKHGNKPNFSQIKERIKLKAQQVFKLKGGETYPNLENINRDLKSAVEKLEAQAPK